MRFKFYTYLLFTTVVTARAVTIPVDHVPQYATAHNPELVAARLRVNEAEARLLGSGKLANPELDLEMAKSVKTPERSLSVAFMQRFPVSGRLALERTVSRAQLAAAAAEIKNEERKLRLVVRIDAVRLIAVKAQRELCSEQLKNSQQQVELVQKRVASGEASAVDASQSSIDGHQLAVELLQLDTEMEALAGSLKRSLGVMPENTLEITGGLSAPEVPRRNISAGNQRPDLLALEFHQEAASKSVDLARARRWDDVGVGLIASGERTEDAPEGFSNDYFLGLRLSIPLPLWNKNEGPIQEAIATAERTRKEAQALEFGIRSEVEIARSGMSTLAKVISEMDRVLLPAAEQLEQQVLSAHQTGQTPLTEVLRSRSRRLELKQRRLDALRDYHIARAQYAEASGTEPLAVERNK